MSQRESGLTIVEEPTNGQIGTAGVGVRYRPQARDGEQVTVEQLWPDGESEPVYIDNEVLPDLIYELMQVHMAVMRDE
jgi:hypothetical protein